MLTISSRIRVLCTRSCAVLSIALALCLGLSCHAQNSAVNFTSTQPIPLTPRPGNFLPILPPHGAACNSLFAGRFNASSRMDFVGSCWETFPKETIFSAALLNRGNGTFASIEDSAADSASDLVVAAADMNGDGFTDLILNKLLAPNDGSSTIGVQISNGDGTFKAPVYYTPSLVNSSLVAATVGDFEDNSHMDVAVLTLTGANNVLNNFLTIFVNNGSGKLTQSATYTLPSSSGDSQFFPLLIAGDLNGDHKTDLVYFDTTRGTAIPFISEGNGKFARGATYTIGPNNNGPNPVSAVIGNFNGDAYGDIAVTTSTGIKVLTGNSSGTFTTSRFTPYPAPAFGSGSTGGSLLAADFDKDGKLDLAMTASNDIYIFWGSGNGTFTSYSAYSVPLAGPDALVASSINNNGREDLAVAEQDGSINILYNMGPRVFRGTPNTLSPNATAIVAADFNGDGKKDVAVVNVPNCNAPCNGSVTVFPSEGNFFRAGKTYTLGMLGAAIAVGDLNGDGVPDLVVTDDTQGDNADTSILLGIKGGGFEAAHNITLGSISNDAFLVDVNGDGKLDLVEDGGVALGNGKGDFGSLTPFPDGISTFAEAPYFATHIAVADFNGDGHPDVVAFINPFDDDVPEQAWVLINNGKGNFTATPINGFSSAQNSYFFVGVGAGPVFGGSINHIIFTYDADTTFGAYVFKNDGKGHFTPANNIAIQNSGYIGLFNGTVAIADFNHDGYPDIGYSNGSQFFVSTGPTFNTPALFFPQSFSSLAVADFNNDGWPDVVSANNYGISRLYNVPVPTVTPASLKFTSASTRTVSIKNTLKTSQAITAGLVLQGTTPAGEPSPFKISSDTCGTLAAGGSCSISVEYNGARTGSTRLYISANGQFIAAIPISGS